MAEKQKASPFFAEGGENLTIERIEKELKKVREQLVLLQERERELLEQKDAAEMAATVKTIEKSKIPLKDIIEMIREREKENKKILEGREERHEEKEII